MMLWKLVQLVRQSEEYLKIINIFCKQLSTTLSLEGPRWLESWDGKRAEIRKRLRFFFSNLPKSINDVPGDNIVNYDETNFTDEPGTKAILFRKGMKHPKSDEHIQVLCFCHVRWFG